MQRLALVLLLAISTAHAARPLTTDDADALDDKACQLEAWVDRSRSQTLAWLAPACNFGLGIEWEVGLSRQWSEGASRFPETYFQAKSAWGTLRDGGWSVGVVGGVIRRPGEATASGWENPYALLLFSTAAGSAATLLHANVGWSRNRAEDRDSALWGVAIEHTVPVNLTLLAESFGSDRGKPFFRVGGRYSAIKDMLDLDLSFVTRSGAPRSERLISIGFHAQADRILP